MDWTAYDTRRNVVGLVEILDAGLVDECPAGIADLHRISVVPLDASLNALAIFEHKHHRRVGLHLLLKIEAFRVRGVLPRGGSVVSHLVGQHRRCLTTHRSASGCETLWQRRTNQLPRPVSGARRGDQRLRRLGSRPVARETRFFWPDGGGRRCVPHMGFASYVG